jgi:ketosteroid isomerase-like protein
MSQENVERMKRLNAGFNRGDAELCASFFHSEAEMVDLNNAPDLPPQTVGRDAIRDALQVWLDAFDELRADIEEYLDVGDHVLCATHWQGRGEASGASVDLRVTDVYEFRDGVIVRGTLGYPTREAALEALGLSGFRG